MSIFSPYVLFFSGYPDNVKVGGVDITGVPVSEEIRSFPRSIRCRTKTVHPARDAMPTWGTA